MDVTIEQGESDALFGGLVYRVYVQLFFNDSKVDIQTVPPDLLSNLLEKYVAGVRSVLLLQPMEKKAAVFRELGFIKRTKGEARINTSLSDLRTINVITIDKFANATIGRTIIELDADIVTLLPQEVISRNIRSSFELHCCSVFLATQYLKYLMEKISDNLRSLSRAIKIAALVPFGISLYFSATSNTLDAILRYLLPLTISAVTPFLYKYVPRVLIRALIGHFFKVAST